MKSITKKLLMLVVIIIVVVLGISKLITTPSKVGIITLNKVINENTSIYGISNDDMNKIQNFYKSFSDMNLPAPKLKYNKQIKLNDLIYQEITIMKHPRTNYGIYQITFTFHFDEYNKDSYDKGEGYTMQNTFNGTIYFGIKKLGFNKWKIHEVKIFK